jgi:hypothetical protein
MITFGPPQEGLVSFYFLQFPTVAQAVAKYNNPMARFFAGRGYNNPQAPQILLHNRIVLCHELYGW